MQRGAATLLSVSFLTVVSGHGGGGGMTKKHRKALFAAQVHTHNGSRISEEMDIYLFAASLRNKN
jgi:predicted chitinase